MSPLLNASPTDNDRERLSPTLLVGVLIAGCVLIGILAVVDAQLALVVSGVLVTVGLLYSCWRWPMSVTPIVVFLLYTNAAVVAVKFHGLPKPVGALVSTPMLIPLFYWWFRRKEPIVITPTLKWFAAFLCVQTVSALLSSDSRDGFSEVTTSIIEGLGIYLVFTNAVRTRNALNQVVWALLASVIFMGGLSLLQELTGAYHNDFGGFAQMSPGRGQRFCGPIGEQNRYAQIMLMIVPICIFQMMAQQTWTTKGIALVAIGLCLSGVVLTYSRGAGVGLAAVLLLMALMRYVKFRHLLLMGVVVSIVLVSVPRYRDRMSSVVSTLGLLSSTEKATEEDEPDGAIKGRATSMLAALRVFADYPIIGVGPGQFNELSREYGKLGGFRAVEESREAHCLYLEIAAETGILGLFTFGGIVFVSMRGLIRTRRLQLEQGRVNSSYITAGFLLALVAYLTTGIFLHLSYARYFWLILALCDANSSIAAKPIVSDSLEPPSTDLATGELNEEGGSPDPVSPDHESSHREESSS